MKTAKKAKRKSDPAAVAMIPTSPDALWRLPRVLAETGLSRTSLYRLMGNDHFPKQLRVTQSTVAWRARDILAWNVARNTAAADAGEPALRASR